MRSIGSTNSLFAVWAARSGRPTKSEGEAHGDGIEHVLPVPAREREADPGEGSQAGELAGDDRLHHLILRGVPLAEEQPANHGGRQRANEEAVVETELMEPMGQGLEESGACVRRCGDDLCARSREHGPILRAHSMCVNTRTEPSERGLA